MILELLTKKDYGSLITYIYGNTLELNYIKDEINMFFFLKPPELSILDFFKDLYRIEPRVRTFFSDIVIRLFKQFITNDTYKYLCDIYYYLLDSILLDINTAYELSQVLNIGFNRDLKYFELLERHRCYFTFEY